MIKLSVNKKQEEFDSNFISNEMNFNTDEDLFEAGYVYVGHYAEIINDPDYERMSLWRHRDTGKEILAYDAGNWYVGHIIEL